MALLSRSQVAQIRSGEELPSVSINFDVAKSFKSLAPNKTVRWQLRFNGEEILSAQARGVYAIGVRTSVGGQSEDTYTTIPWFYGAQQVKPTKVVLAVPITTINNHLVDSPIRNLQKDSLKLNRIAQLTATANNDISWIVDPALIPWLGDFAQTPLEAKANLVQTKLRASAKSRWLAPYGHANISMLAGSKQEDEISALTDYGRNLLTGNGTIYYSKSESLNRTTLSNAVLNNITPMVTNQFVSGNAYVTTAARATAGDHTVLVYDKAASTCLDDTVTTKNIYTVKSCLLSAVGMMTAESPGRSRTVIILAPTQWSISAKHLNQLVNALNSTPGMSVVSMKQAYASPFASYINRLDEGRTNVPNRIQSGVAKLNRHADTVASMVTDRTWQSTVEPMRFIGYSDLWHKTALAAAYLEAAKQRVDALAQKVTIQASSRITIATTSADIPVTIVNESSHVVRVRVTITSDSPRKLQVTPSPLVTVPVGKRVTVAVPITLSGTGSIAAKAQLVAPNNDVLSHGRDITIASTAYRQVASTLVRIAFALLVLLAVSNVIRRRKQKQSQQGDVS